MIIYVLHLLHLLCKGNGICETSCLFSKCLKFLSHWKEIQLTLQKLCHGLESDLWNIFMSWKWSGNGKKKKHLENLHKYPLAKLDWEIL